MQWQPLGKPVCTLVKPDLWALVQSRLLALNQHACLLQGLLDDLCSGVILLGPDGKVRHLSTRARQVLKQHGGLKFHERHGLQAVIADQDSGLQDILLKSVSGARSPRSQVYGLQCEHGGAPLVLRVLALGNVDGNDELSRNGIAAAILLLAPPLGQTLSRELLQQVYALSDREFELCQAFLCHASLEGVAGECGLTLGTVRAYMKGIYAKTGQHSQAQLMRLLWGLALQT